MPRLLYIEASPRKSRSGSSEVAKAFVDAFREVHRSAFVDSLDLWAKPLPEFDQNMLDAKYAVLGGQSFTAPQKTAWGEIERMVDRLKAADVIVLSTPMWNFSIPYKLKHYLDLIMQPGLSFGYDPARGYFGSLTNKVAVKVLSSMGNYAPGTPAAGIDFQSGYLRFVLQHLGIQEQHEIRFAPSGGSADAIAALKSEAIAQAKQIASDIKLQGFEE